MPDAGPTMISCPACAGVLHAESSTHRHLVFVCSVGHTFSLEDLYQAKEESVEEYEWSVVALLKHLQMILGLLLESPSGTEPFSVETIRRREVQVREQIARIEQVIQETHIATRVPIVVGEPFLSHE